MKLTVLQMTQSILNDMNSDSVNNLNDTHESEQIAEIIRATYYEMLGNRSWPHLKQLFQLTGLGDITQPSTMVLPVELSEMSWLRYNKKKVDSTRDFYQPVQYLQPQDFVDHSNGRNTDQDNIIRVQVDGVTVLVRTDVQPTKWTTFDEQFIVFDSYNSAVEDSMQASNTQCQGYINPAWEYDNDFVPDMTAEGFPSLLAEAKSTAFIMLRQESNPKAEQRARRQSRWLSRKSWIAEGGVRYPNYGRRATMSGQRQNPLLDKNDPTPTS
jgi:hypothetical protein